MRRPAALLLAVLLLNAALVAAWIWAQSEHQTITVASTGPVAQAFAGSTALATYSGEVENGAVGFYVAEPVPTGAALPDLVGVLEHESAWGDVTVRDARTGAALASRPATWSLAIPWQSLIGGRPLGFGQEEWLGDPAMRDYIVKADLWRGRELVGVEVLSGTDQSPFLLLRPLARDAAWYKRGSVGAGEPAVAAPYRLYQKSLPGMVQDNLRLFLRAYPYTLLVALVVAFAGGVGAIFGVGGRLDESRRRRELLDRRLSSVNSSYKRAAAWRPTPQAVGRACTALAVLVAVAGVGIGAVVSTDLLERLPHVQDSVGYLFQAKLFALGRLSAPVPPLPEFFQHEFILMNAKGWYSKYTPGHPVLLALGVLAGAPWLVNPIASGLSLFMLYLIGRRLYGPGTGLLAAALGLVSPFFIFLSGSMMSHPTGLLFVLLFVWLFLQGADSKGNSRRNREDGWGDPAEKSSGVGPVSAVLAGFALGFAVLIRSWTAGLIAIPFAVVALGQLSTNPRRALPRYLLMALGFAPLLALLLAWNYFQSGNALKTGLEMWWPTDTLGFGPDHGLWGHTPVDGLWNTSRNMGELLTHLFGWPPFLTLGFVTALFAFGRARRHDWLLLAAFGCLVVGYVFWWADGIMFGPRFYFEGVGFLFLLTARGVIEVGRMVRAAARPWGFSGPWVGTVIAGGLLVLLVTYNALYYLPGQWKLYQGYNYVHRTPVATVENADVHHAVVFAYVGKSSEWWNYGMVFSSNSPLLDTDVIYARDLGDAENRKLMALYPDRTFYRLHEDTITRIR